MADHPVAAVVTPILAGVLVDVGHWLTTGSNWTGSSGILARTGEHLVICGEALGLALLIALPIGLVLGHFGRGGLVAINVSNIGRAVPTFGLLVLLASWDTVGVGNEAAVLALTFFAIPPILTNTYVGMTAVDRDVRDAARGMGMTGGQVVLRVELPLALPLMAAGIRTAVVQVVATATLAAVVGSGGLGRFVYDGFATHTPGEYLGGAVVVIALAVLLEAVLGRIQALLERRLGKIEVAGPEPVAEEAQLSGVA